MHFRFTIRDLLWLTMAVAIAAGLWRLIPNREPRLNVGMPKPIGLQILDYSDGGPRTGRRPLPEEAAPP